MNSVNCPSGYCGPVRRIVKSKALVRRICFCTRLAQGAASSILAAECVVEGRVETRTRIGNPWSRAAGEEKVQQVDRRADVDPAVIKGVGWIETLRIIVAHEQKTEQIDGIGNIDIAGEVNISSNKQPLSVFVYLLCFAVTVPLTYSFFGGRGGP